MLRARGSVVGIWLELLVIVGLIIANGLFAGAEIAIISLRKSRIQELMNEGSKGARRVSELRANPDRFLATVQVGITVIGATAAALGGATLADPVRLLLQRIGIGQHADAIALALVVAFVSYLSLVLGELVPKSLALRSAERYALTVARPLTVLSRVARPLVWILTASSNAVLRLFGDRTSFAETHLSKDELQQLVGDAATSGSLGRHASEIASRALEFDEIRVEALMIPRAEMLTLPLEASAEEIRQVLRDKPHSRIPIHRGTVDDIAGYVTAREVVALLMGDATPRLETILRDGVFIPAGRPAAKVLRQMQRSKQQLAFVVDEHGGVAGLVTLEDIVEELVGEIFAEHDELAPAIRRDKDGSYVVAGRMAVHELNRELGLELPESAEWTTIAGLATSLAGAVPRAGTRLDAGRATLEVMDASERRVFSLRVEAHQPSR